MACLRERFKAKRGGDSNSHMSYSYHLLKGSWERNVDGRGIFSEEAVRQLTTTLGWAERHTGSSLQGQAVIAM